MGNFEKSVKSLVIQVDKHIYKLENAFSQNNINLVLYYFKEIEEFIKQIDFYLKKININLGKNIDIHNEYKITKDKYLTLKEKINETLPLN